MNREKLGELRESMSSGVMLADCYYRCFLTDECKDALKGVYGLWLEVCKGVVDGTPIFYGDKK